jgi:DNA-binding protein HU-beta
LSCRRNGRLYRLMKADGNRWVLGDPVTLATKHLKKGDKIRLTGLGILQVRARPARMKSIEIAASKKIAFRPAKELKEAV